MIRTNNEPSAAELAALLILTRLSHFFCGMTPFSSAYAVQSVLITAVQLLLMLPILHRTQGNIPRITTYALRIFALLLAAKAAAETYRFLCLADAPRPASTLALLLFTVLYGLSLPRYTVGRAAIFVLSASVIALLLLPLGGISSAKLSALWRNDTPPPLWQEWADSAEVAVLPILIHRAKNHAKRAVSVWFGVRILLIPLLLLYGTMQCGRLQINGSSPFLTLLERVPFSDTLRTDGLWWMLTVACCLLTIQFLLQICIPRADAPRQICCTGIAALTALTILFIMYPPNSLFFAGCSALLCIAAWIPRKGRAV